MLLCIVRTFHRWCDRRYRYGGETLRNALQYAVRDFGVGLFERVAESKRVRVAVALDDPALQSDERRPVVAPRVDAPLERRQHRQREQAEQLAHRIARELLAQELREHERQSLRGLERA